MTWFRDVLNAPELNWGCNPITVRTEIQDNPYGMPVTISKTEEVFDDISSPQLLDLEEIQKLGLGDFENNELYEVYSIKEIKKSKALEIRTALFNGKEYDIVASSFFGVMQGTDKEDGYYHCLFGKLIRKLNANMAVD